MVLFSCKRLVLGVSGWNALSVAVTPPMQYYHSYEWTMCTIPHEVMPVLLPAEWFYMRNYKTNMNSRWISTLLCYKPSYRNSEMTMHRRPIATIIIRNYAKYWRVLTGHKFTSHLRWLFSETFLNFTSLQSSVIAVWKIGCSPRKTEIHEAAMRTLINSSLWTWNCSCVGDGRQISNDWLSINR